MKITETSIFYVKPGWLIVKLATDTEFVGYGECDLSGPPDVVALIVAEWGGILQGEDPRRIEHLWQRMRQAAEGQGGSILYGAISGIEQALWDLTGKAAGLPVHQMLGGACRSRIRMQARCGGETPEDIATIAKGLRLKNYKSIKIALEAPQRPVESKAYIDRQVARLQAARAEVGDDIDIAVTIHPRCGPAIITRLLQALEPNLPLFCEFSTPPDGAGTLLLPTLAGLNLPIAAGRHLHARWAFRDLLAQRTITVAQPDVCQVGGIFEARKIAAMAEAYGISVAPLNPRGPIALAASLQLAACIPNLLVLEHAALLSRWDVGHGILNIPFEIRGGHLAVPTGPGLGIDVNDAFLAERAIPATWTPILIKDPDDMFLP